MKTSHPQSLRDTVLDWFERNPTSAMRAAMLGKAIKVTPDRVADTCAKLAAEGLLTRCQVTVPDSERGTGRAKQFEYRLPAGSHALTSVKPYVPPKPARREIATQLVSDTPAGGGGNITGSHASDHLPVVVSKQDEGEAVAEQPTEHSEPPLPSAGDETACCKHKADLDSMFSAAWKFCTITKEMTGSEHMPLNLYECSQLLESHIGELDSRISLLEHQLSNAEQGEKIALDIAESEKAEWLALAGEYECKSIPELRVFINATVDRINSLKAENCALKVLNETMPGFGAAFEANQQASDMVNNPPHYTAGQVECIDAIESALTPDEYRGYCKGNALKYIWRERHKGGAESIAKAGWYLNRVPE